MSKMTDATRAPCGCVFGNVGEVFVMEPCSETCETYAYALTEARKKTISINPIDLSDSGAIKAFVPRCPHCAAVIDGWSGPKGTAPKPDDVSVCCYCGEFGIYASDDIRKPTKRELRELRDDTVLRNLQTVMKANLRPYPFNDRKSS